MNDGKVKIELNDTVRCWFPGDRRALYGYVTQINVKPGSDEIASVQVQSPLSLDTFPVERVKLEKRAFEYKIQYGYDFADIDRLYAKELVKRHPVSYKSSITNDAGWEGRQLRYQIGMGLLREFVEEQNAAWDEQSGKWLIDSPASGVLRARVARICQLLGTTTSARECLMLKRLSKRQSPDPKVRYGQMSFTGADFKLNDDFKGLLNLIGADHQPITGFDLIDPVFTEPVFLWQGNGIRIVTQHNPMEGGRDAGNIWLQGQQDCIARAANFIRDNSYAASRNDQQNLDHKYGFANLDQIPRPVERYPGYSSAFKRPIWQVTRKQFVDSMASYTDLWKSYARELEDTLNIVDVVELQSGGTNEFKISVRPTKAKAREYAQVVHEYWVRTALEEGKQVAEEILADYPDLHPQQTGRQNTAPTPEAEPQSLEAARVYGHGTPVNVFDLDLGRFGDKGTVYMPLFEQDAPASTWRAFEVELHQGGKTTVSFSKALQSSIIPTLVEVIESTPQYHSTEGELLVWKLTLAEYLCYISITEGVVTSAAYSKWSPKKRFNALALHAEKWAATHSAAVTAALREGENVDYRIAEPYLPVTESTGKVPLPVAETATELAEQNTLPGRQLTPYDQVAYGDAVAWVGRTGVVLRGMVVRGQTIGDTTFTVGNITGNFRLQPNEVWLIARSSDFKELYGYDLEDIARLQESGYFDWSPLALPKLATMYIGHGHASPFGQLVRWAVGEALSREWREKHDYRVDTTKDTAFITGRTTKEVFEELRLADQLKGEYGEVYDYIVSEHDEAGEPFDFHGSKPDEDQLLQWREAFWQWADELGFAPYVNQSHAHRWLEHHRPGAGPYGSTIYQLNHGSETRSAYPYLVSTARLSGLPEEKDWLRLLAVIGAPNEPRTGISPEFPQSRPVYLWQGSEAQLVASRNPLAGEGGPLLISLQGTGATVLEAEDVLRHSGSRMVEPGNRSLGFDYIYFDQDNNPFDWSQLPVQADSTNAELRQLVERDGERLSELTVELLAFRILHEDLFPFAFPDPPDTDGNDGDDGLDDPAPSTPPGGSDHEAENRFDHGMTAEELILLRLLGSGTWNNRELDSGAEAMRWPYHKLRSMMDGLRQRGLVSTGGLLTAQGQKLLLELREQYPSLIRFTRHNEAADLYPFYRDLTLKNLDSVRPTHRWIALALDAQTIVEPWNLTIEQLAFLYLQIHYHSDMKGTYWKMLGWHDKVREGFKAELKAIGLLNKAGAVWPKTKKLMKAVEQAHPFIAELNTHSHRLNAFSRFVDKMLDREVAEADPQTTVEMPRANREAAASLETFRAMPDWDRAIRAGDEVMVMDVGLATYGRIGVVEAVSAYDDPRQLPVFNVVFEGSATTVSAWEVVRKDRVSDLYRLIANDPKLWNLSKLQAWKLTQAEYLSFMAIDSDEVVGLSLSSWDWEVVTDALKDHVGGWLERQRTQVLEEIHTGRKLPEVLYRPYAPALPTFFEAEPGWITRSWTDVQFTESVRFELILSGFGRKPTLLIGQDHYQQGATSYLWQTADIRLACSRHPLIEDGRAGNVVLAGKPELVEQLEWQINYFARGAGMQAREDGSAWTLSHYYYPKPEDTPSPKAGKQERGTQVFDHGLPAMDLAYLKFLSADGPGLAQQGAAAMRWRDWEVAQMLNNLLDEQLVDTDGDITDRGREVVRELEAKYPAYGRLDWHQPDHGSYLGWVRELTLRYPKEAKGLDDYFRIAIAASQHSYKEGLTGEQLAYLYIKENLDSTTRHWALRGMGLSIDEADNMMARLKAEGWLGKNGAPLKKATALVAELSNQYQSLRDAFHKGEFSRYYYQQFLKELAETKADSHVPGPDVVNESGLPVLSVDEVALLRLISDKQGDSISPYLISGWGWEENQLQVSELNLQKLGLTTTDNYMTEKGERTLRLWRERFPQLGRLTWYSDKSYQTFLLGVARRQPTWLAPTSEKKRLALLATRGDTYSTLSPDEMIYLYGLEAVPASERENWYSTLGFEKHDLEVVHHHLRQRALTGEKVGSRSKKGRDLSKELVQRFPALEELYPAEHGSYLQGFSAFMAELQENRLLPTADEDIAAQAGRAIPAGVLPHTAETLWFVHHKSVPATAFDMPEKSGEPYILSDGGVLYNELAYLFRGHLATLGRTDWQDFQITSIDVRFDKPDFDEPMLLSDITSDQPNESYYDYGLRPIDMVWLHLVEAKGNEQAYRILLKAGLRGGKINRIPRQLEALGLFLWPGTITQLGEQALATARENHENLRDFMGTHPEQELYWLVRELMHKFPEQTRSIDVVTELAQRLNSKVGGSGYTVEELVYLFIRGREMQVLHDGYFRELGWTPQDVQRFDQKAVRLGLIDANGKPAGKLPGAIDFVKRYPRLELLGQKHLGDYYFRAKELVKQPFDAVSYQHSQERLWKQLPDSYTVAVADELQLEGRYPTTVTARLDLLQQADPALTGEVVKSEEPSLSKAIQYARLIHRKAVEQALAQGFDVPDYVLRQYEDLEQANVTSDMKQDEEVLAVLRESEVRDNILYLPDRQLDRKLYQRVAKQLTELKGKWNRSAQGFVFKSDPSILVARILDGESFNITKEMQFFPAPEGLAKRMIEAAGITAEHTVLNPFAKSDVFSRLLKGTATVDLCQPHKEVRELLAEDGLKTICNDFFDFDQHEVYDRIVSSPPFRNSEYIDYFERMYEVLAPGGRIVATAPVNYEYREDRKHTAFRDWLDEVDATIEEIPEGTYKGDGVQNAMRLIVIDKPAAAMASTATEDAPVSAQTAEVVKLPAGLQLEHHVPHPSWFFGTDIENTGHLPDDGPQGEEFVWQLSQQAYQWHNSQQLGRMPSYRDPEDAKAHEWYVVEALNQGYEVPATVMEDYPEVLARIAAHGQQHSAVNESGAATDPTELDKLREAGLIGQTNAGSDRYAWELSQLDYQKEMAIRKTGSPRVLDARDGQVHERLVMAAMEAGLEVAAEAVETYPELKAQFNAKMKHAEPTNAAADVMQLTDEEALAALHPETYFKENPDAVLGQRYETTNRFNRKVMGVRGSLDQALEKMQVPESKLPQARHSATSAAAARSGEGGDEVQTKAATKEGRKNIEKAIKRTRKRKAEAILNEDKPAKATLDFEEVLDQYNDEIDAEDIRVWVWYKLRTGGYNNPGKVLGKASGWAKYRIEKAEEKAKVKQWMEQGRLCYHEGDFMPAVLYYAENIYDRISQLQIGKEACVAAHGQAQYDRQLEGLRKTMPGRLKLADPKVENRLYISPISDIAKEVEVYELADGTKVSRYSHQERKDVPATLQRAFVKWINTLAPNDFKKSTKYDIEHYYLLNRTPPRRYDKDEKLRMKQNAKVDGERLFAVFLAEALKPEDQVKIEQVWNARYNGYVPVNYFKVPIAFSCSATFKNKPLFIRPAQREGLGFLSVNGSGCIAYDVGLGKTMTGILSIAQAIESGQCKRPFIVVPNQTYKNWLAEIRGAVNKKGDVTLTGVLPQYQVNDLYNLGTGYFDQLLDKQGNIKPLPEYSISVMTYEGFNKLGFDDSTWNDIGNELYGILNQGNESRREEQVLREKISGMMGAGLKGGMANIEQLGLDYMVIDEAHACKKSFVAVKGEVAGGKRERSQYQIRSGTPSKIALRAFMLSQYILRTNNMRNVVLLTATPFTNSPLEIYSMLALIGYQALTSSGIKNLKTFFDTFIKTSLELVINAKMKPERKEIVLGFNNLIALQQLIFRFIAYKTGEEAGIQRPDKWVLPLKNKQVNGKWMTLPEDEQVSTNLPMTRKQRDFMLDVEGYVTGKKELHHFCVNPAGAGDESEDGQGGSAVDERKMTQDEEESARVLRGLSFARQLALSPHLYACNPDGEPNYREYVEASPKLSYVMECIRTVKEWHENNGEEPSGQVIYMNAGVAYFDLIKQYLVEIIGYTEKEVGIIRSGMSASKKEGIKERFLGGGVKIIIGSATIKEGINLQNRATVLCNCWLDWNPTDVKQLEGRIWRYGNRYANVRIVNPLMENSIDSFIFQKLEEKTSRINEIWSRVGITNQLNLEEFNPAELKMGLITDPTALAELMLMGEREQMRDEIMRLNNQTEVLAEIARARTDFDQSFDHLREKVDQYKPPREGQGPRATSTIFKIYRDWLDDKDQYTNYQDEARYETARKAFAIIERGKEEILEPRGLTLDFDQEQVLKKLKEEIKTVETNLTEKAGDHAVKILAAKLMKDRERLGIRQATVEERVAEFATLNEKLLSEKMVYGTEEATAARDEERNKTGTVLIDADDRLARIRQKRTIMVKFQERVKRIANLRNAAQAEQQSRSQAA